ncbi:hypothetical protein SAMN04488121_102894 [Chitinophaga filiformis]|uniref:Uncharacterized protein n=1 Tax=Chitinophaga filiformis TaxID=104663 RepID=A0A1G7NQD9_CHIFI|nr:hypothetical protein SAMN04488121_102894 [Chitinophaga filiformis]
MGLGSILDQAPSSLIVQKTGLSAQKKAPASAGAFIVFCLLQPCKDVYHPLHRQFFVSNLKQKYYYPATGTYLHEEGLPTDYPSSGCHWLYNRG